MSQRLQERHNSISLMADMLLCNWQENSQNASLVEATLDTLLRFLNWIPLGYVFETKLINTLICKVIENHSMHFCHTVSAQHTVLLSLIHI